MDVTVVVEPLVGVERTGTVDGVVSIRTVHVLAHALKLPTVSLDRAVQYHNPSESVIVALDIAVYELKTVPVKSGAVDARIV